MASGISSSLHLDILLSETVDGEPEEAGEIENVRVIVRVRPFDEKEKDSLCNNIVAVDTRARTVTVTKPNPLPNEQPKTFTFDCVFDTNSSQIDLYVETARPIVDKVLEGYNGTILAYGQTGTGKTYTMAGLPTAAELKGIIPNTFAHIFGHIAKSQENKKFLVRVTYLEIYNEEVRDLLGKEPCRSLEVKERPDIGVFVKDLSGYVVHNADDLEKIMQIGNKNRVIGATAMNSESSRSHAIFSITVESSQEGEDKQQHVKMGKLHLVDLAGSERQSKTQATGMRLKEATKINLSLSVLGNVISALVDGKSTHIPYRNSKLTRLLQDSLGGNSKTVMCANIGPADINFDETISTLRYANRAKNIQNRAHVNEEPKDALLRHFQEEIEELRKQLENEEMLHEEEIELSEEEAVEEEEDDSGETEKKPKKKREKKIRNTVDERNGTHEKADNEKTETEKDPYSEEHEVELNQTKSEQAALRDKLQNLQNKILVGGENLLEKAETQEHLLESSAAELEQRRTTEQTLKESIQQKEAERINIEERYSSLQEENLGKTKKLERVMQMYQAARADIADLQQENQREMESMFDNVRSLTRELQLTDLILDSYIPKEYQKMIENYAHWNEDIGEWQLRCVAYTGNNMRKQVVTNTATHNKEPDPVDLSSVYLSYNSDSVTEPVRAKTARPKTRARTSGVPRPTTARHQR